jgi:hypothetical protein
MIFKTSYFITKPIHSSSVKIAVWLNDWGLIPDRDRDISLCHHIQTDWGATQPPTTKYWGLFPQE